MRLSIAFSHKGLLGAGRKWGISFNRLCKVRVDTPRFRAAALTEPPTSAKADLIDSLERLARAGICYLPSSRMVFSAAVYSSDNIVDSLIMLVDQNSSSARIEGLWFF